MENKRKFIRISTILPVEFYVVDSQGKKITPWIQGFTRDIGKGGILLLVNDLWWGFWDKIRDNEENQFFLQIEVPFKKRPIPIKARPVWFKEDRAGVISRYIIGLKFLEGNSPTAISLFKYALAKKLTPLVAGLASLIFAFFFFSLLTHTVFLTKENKRVVKDYVDIITQKSSLEQTLYNEQKNSESLKDKQQELKESIASLNDKISQYKHEGLDSSEEVVKKVAREKQILFELELESLKRENEFLKNKMKESKESISEIQDEVYRLEASDIEYSPKIIKGMHDWIKNHQNPLTGLVLSYEGDRNLEKVSFTYDQALAAITFLILGDEKSAESTLDFYLKKAKRKKGVYNAYFMNGEPFEYVIHSGPNAWIGLAALNHMKKTNSKKYLTIARRTADFLYSVMDIDGGIKGGPAESWCSTEHNLDALAFFDLFYKLTGKKQYLETAQKMKRWIRSHTYTECGPPVKRGKGDATVATDTYAWSITAFGPRELYYINMNPEMILEFAIENCEVTAEFKTADSNTKVRGFDFAKSRNIARGGIVSSEWTSQMILAFEIMAEYFEDKDPEKAKEYMYKAMYYFNELKKMLIVSLSRSGRKDPCLPYASSPNVDTGHGWRTPKGDRTGSLSSTAYFLLAYHGYNPLKAQFLSSSLKEACENKLKKRQQPEKMEWTDVVLLDKQP